MSLTAEEIDLIVKGIFGGSVLIFFYVVYRIIKEAISDKEKLETQIGELNNENKVNSLSPDELIDLINKQQSPRSGTSAKKPGGSV